jgi:hypothetical protein
MIKTKSNFKLFDEDIIPKFYCLMVPYSFIVVFNQTTFIFLIAHKPHQLFSQLTTHDNFFHNHSQTNTDP